MDREALKAIIRDVLRKRLAHEPGVGVAGSLGRPLDLVTEREVLAARAADKLVPLGPRAVITPLARETAERYGVRLERASVLPGTGRGSAARAPTPALAGLAAPGAACAAHRGERIALGADHGGFALKEGLKRFLGEEAGYQVIDFGTDSEDPVDYPDLAHKVAGAVSRGEAWRGILVDGVGVGSAMAANRHPGVRAAAPSGVLAVVNAREHNDANILCLGGRIMGDLLARALTVTFLGTEFAGGRHARRVAKIEEA